ncbi:MAG: PQQ-binding-like beta-propeller repeat protein [Planctomycetes bacterium]|nr:PQQ-binding-like beta-propeller repeat protein [Planctomycetota bacterium]
MFLRVFILMLLAMPLAAAEPWSTYRGNPQRSGNTDGKVGPEKPTVLWAYRSQDHFIASPVPSADSVIFSGLGAFNRPNMLALPINPKKVVEPTWTRTSPYLKLPTVSSPAISGKTLIFGDGMHQTDGAVLHCIPADGSMPLWQLTIPGELVHLEGSPSVSGNRVYMGGGAAGVLCVETDKAAIDGKEYDLPTLSKMQGEKWKELQAKFEVEKKKDPDFAIPPSDDQLHKAKPKILWQQGSQKWHVDAPVNVVGDKVIVASAFLEKEKVGDRAIYCLNAATGDQVWRAALDINPWGGAAIEGDTVIVTSSTIAYDPKALKGAKGEIVALDLAKGTVLWKKEVPGGVLGCAAIANGLAVFTCSDGKVRAFSLKDGERRMLYDAKAPIFAPPAVVGDTVYAADLKGIVHAIDLKSGSAKWMLDLGNDPLVKSPGMVYGGIMVHDGKLFLGTCNLEGPNVRQGTVVVCIGAK